MKETSPESIRQIAINLLKKVKNTDRVNVSSVEQENGVWIVRGTCPIDMEGHPWVEKFEVIIDQKGRIKSMDYSLL